MQIPNVVPVRKTIRLGSGEFFTRETFSIEMQAQSVADVRAMMIDLARTVTLQQIGLGNPPAHLEVDGKTDKGLDQFDKRAVIIYGVTLATAAMREVEIELASAIARSTEAHTGRLRDVAATWRWILVPRKGVARPVSASAPLLTFQAGDMLCLVPETVPYATKTNVNVARSGKLAVKPRRGKQPKKSDQQIGFLGLTTRRVRSRQVFRQFSVKVATSRPHKVPGELWWGTAYIYIRPRVKLTRV